MTDSRVSPNTWTPLAGIFQNWFQSLRANGLLDLSSLGFTFLVIVFRKPVSVSPEKQTFYVKLVSKN